MEDLLFVPVKHEKRKVSKLMKIANKNPSFFDCKFWKKILKKSFYYYSNGNGLNILVKETENTSINYDGKIAGKSIINTK